MNSFSYLNDLIIPGGIIIAQIMAVLMPVLISVAFLVYAERKVLALIQLRRGPNVVGPFGILQSFADALKLLTKENINEKINSGLKPHWRFKLNASIIEWHDLIKGNVKFDPKLDNFDVSGINID